MGVLSLVSCDAAARPIFGSCEMVFREIKRTVLYCFNLLHYLSLFFLKRVAEGFAENYEKGGQTAYFEKLKLSNGQKEF